MPTDADDTGSWRVDTRLGPVDPSRVLPPPVVDATPTSPPLAGPPPFHDYTLADPTPTGELPAVTVDEPTAVGGDGRTPARRRLMWAAAIVAPVVLFVLGVSLIVAGIGFDWSSGGPSRSRGSTGVPTALPVATAAAAVAGDPALAATDLVTTFTAMLQARRFADAAALTDKVFDEAKLTVGYGTFADLRTAIVRIAPVGPDEYHVRLVVYSETGPDDQPTARCEQWSVNPAARRVIPGLAEQITGDLLALRGQALADGLAGSCATAPLG